MNTSMNRRSFLKAAGAAAAGTALSTASTAMADETQSWDKECEILVVGYGGAGASAAITAATEGLGDVLVIEAAPEGDEGGNTRVSGQIIFCPRSVGSVGKVGVSARPKAGAASAGSSRILASEKQCERCVGKAPHRTATRN